MLMYKHRKVNMATSRVETMKAKYGEDVFARMGKKGGLTKAEGRGFASKKKDANGLTGAERAKKAGALSKRGTAHKRTEEQN